MSKQHLSSVVDEKEGERFWGEVGMGMIKCPFCKDDDHYQHAITPETIPANDNYEAGWGGRGDQIIVPFWGECGHTWQICFGFHKGNTACWVEARNE